MFLFSLSLSGIPHSAHQAFSSIRELLPMWHCGYFWPWPDCFLAKFISFWSCCLHDTIAIFGFDQIVFEPYLLVCAFFCRTCEESEKTSKDWAARIFSRDPCKCHCCCLYANYWYKSGWKNWPKTEGKWMPRHFEPSFSFVCIFYMSKFWK